MRWLTNFSADKKEWPWIEPTKYAIIRQSTSANIVGYICSMTQSVLWFITFPLFAKSHPNIWKLPRKHHDCFTYIVRLRNRDFCVYDNTRRNHVLSAWKKWKKNPNGRNLRRRHESLETPPITQCDLHLEKPAATNEAEVWSQVWWLQCLLSATSHQNEEHSSSDSICVIGPLLKASWSEKL